MKRFIVIAILVSISLMFGCKGSKSSDDEEMTNALRVGVKYACPIKILTENIYSDKIIINFDGGNSTVDANTGKWTGNGVHVEFTMNKATGDKLPTGTFTIGEDIIEAKYSEDFNNDGPNYMPLLQLEEGILTSSYNAGIYTFDFTGVDQNDSTIVMNYSDGLSYTFDYSDK